jgi:hypothetical protein
MPLTRRTLVVVSLVIGIVAGAAVAALAGGDGVSVPTAAVRLTVARTAPPLKAGPGQLGWTPRPQTVAIVARAADPGGGPDWAIRRSVGRNVLPPGVPRKHIGKELFGDHVFYELGRIAHGAFGWLDGSGTFRPVAAGAGTTLRESFPAIARPRDRQAVDSATLVSHPAFGEPVPVTTIVWGVAGEAARGVTVQADGAGAGVHLGAHGAFLAFLPARGAAPKLDVRVKRAGGRTSALNPRFMRPSARQPLAGPARLAARTADPSGGAPWGVSAAPARGGGWCTGNPGRVVDGAVGMLNSRLDVFSDQTDFVYYCPPSRAQQRRSKPKYRPLTRARPLIYSFTSGSVPSEERSSDLGRTALRTLPGSLVFAGLARADVRLITVTTPEQTRVLHPSAGAHGFAVAFAGTFPSGVVRFDVTFADGRHATQVEHVGDL